MPKERAEAFFPLRAATTAADSKRDARAAPKKGSAADEDAERVPRRVGVDKEWLRLIVRPVEK